MFQRGQSENKISTLNVTPLPGQPHAVLKGDSHSEGDSQNKVEGVQEVEAFPTYVIKFGHYNDQLISLFIKFQKCLY